MNYYIVYFFAFLFISCKKEAIEPVSNPRHFVIVDGVTQSMKVTLTWKVNGQAEGYKFINCDLYISDTTLMNEESFMASTSQQELKDWKNCPVLLSSIGDYNTKEEIHFAKLPFRILESRKYLGVAVNGLGYLANTTNQNYTIDYTLTISSDNQPAEIIEGSFEYNTSLANKTFINYISTLDIDNSRTSRVYSFRLLDKPIHILRDSDIRYTTILDIETSLLAQYKMALVLKLDWTVDGIPDYKSDTVDLDFNGEGIQYDIISDKVDQFEEMKLYPYFEDLNYKLGMSYLENLTTFPGPKHVNYRYTIYHTSNPFLQYQLEKSFNTPPINPDYAFVFWDIDMVQSNYTINFNPL